MPCRCLGTLCSLILVLALAVAAPAQATVSTVYSCSSSGSSGNHDTVSNGFIISNLAAANLHTVTLFYNTSLDGPYDITLIAHTSSFAGPVVASNTQSTNLSSSSDSAVTFSMGDAAITSGSTLYFTHNTSGSGGVNFNLQPTLCPNDIETVGLDPNESNGFSVAVTITENTTPPPPACTSNSTTLCIDDQPGDKRFEVRISFATAEGGGHSGNGEAIQLNTLGVNEGGLFWFFASANPEMLIKVLNGCGTNSHYWVFYSATTNVGFHVTVVDTKKSRQVSYSNPDQTAAESIQDTSAFTCP